jgi:xanthine dehydrogenase accessory factor
MERKDWSVPEATVVEAAREVIDEGRAAVLATIIAVEGSAYRRPGAKMVVAADGEGIGSITAGCLEDEVITLAREVAETGQARVETYDLTADDDVWGLGVGCNGVIDVLLEPLEASYRPAIEAFDSGSEGAICTVVEVDKGENGGMPVVGERAFYDASTGEFPENATDWPATLCEQVREAAATAATDGLSHTIALTHESTDLRVFVDGIETPPELVIFGTGHDIGPLAELASKNDFRVTVLGFRGATATADRFPAAQEVRSSAPANVTAAYEFDSNTYAVVMSHNFIDDRLALEELLETPVPYIGMLGPRERFEEMRAEFDAEDRPLTAAERERIYTPIGLDLGSETPYQIAHSIVAELLAVHNDRDPRHLTTRDGPIHDRVELAGSEADD